MFNNLGEPNEELMELNKNIQTLLISFMKKYTITDPLLIRAIGQYLHGTIDVEVSACLVHGRPALRKKLDNELRMRELKSAPEDHDV